MVDVTEVSVPCSPEVVAQVEQLRDLVPGLDPDAAQCMAVSLSDDTGMIALILRAADGFDSVTGLAIIVGCAGILALFALLIAYCIFVQKIDIKLLLSETNGKASLSRFQALIFTFVLGACLLSIVVETGDLPQRIPWEIVAILGGSLGTYLMSKGIQRRHGISVSGRGSDGTMADPRALLWFGTGPVFQVDPSNNAFRSEMHSTQTIPARSGNNTFVPVAVAVGTCHLRVTYSAAAGAVAAARIRYVDQSGAETVADLDDTGSIVTAAEHISEVAVHFKAQDTESPVVVQISRGTI